MLEHRDALQYLTSDSVPVDQQVTYALIKQVETSETLCPLASIVLIFPVILLYK